MAETNKKKYRLMFSFLIYLYYCQVCLHNLEKIVLKSYHCSLSIFAIRERESDNYFKQFLDKRK